MHAGFGIQKFIQHNYVFAFQQAPATLKCAPLVAQCIPCFMNNGSNLSKLFCVAFMLQRYLIQKGIYGDTTGSISRNHFFTKINCILL